MMVARVPPLVETHKYGIGESKKEQCDELELFLKYVYYVYMHICVCEYTCTFVHIYM